MKLQIKTLSRKSLVIEIEETKTVYELKMELSLYPDIGVKPELQKLIYAGKILQNEDKLSVYNIDVKKFLVVMVLKQPLFELAKARALKQPQTKNEKPQKVKGKSKAASSITKSPSTPASTSATDSEAEFKTPTEPSDSRKENLVKQIVGMGYPEPDVRKALVASFYNPERAIEYLVEGIPSTSSTQQGESYSDTDANSSISPFELFRGNPVFQRLRSALQQHPEYLNAAIRRIGQTNPSLLNLISENQPEFLRLLLDEDDDDEINDDDDDDGEED